MRRIRALVLRLAGMFDWSTRDREFTTELESHLQLEIDDGVRAGMPAEEARRRALAKFGGVAAATQAQRERRSLPWLEHLGQDLRYSIRGLRHGVSWTAIGMLAIAIGLSTAMYAVVDALLLNPVPFRDADRLSYIIMRGRTGGTRGISPVVIEAWRKTSVVEGVEAIRRAQPAVLDAAGGPIVRESAELTPDMLTMLGVSPVRGRGFTDDDARRGADDGVVLISEELWRTSFQRDPAILGTRVRVNRQAVTIVGVLPSGFRFPDWNTEVWRPLDLAAISSSQRSNLPVTYVRWKSGIGADEMLKVLAGAAQAADPARHAGQWATAGNVAGWALETYYRHSLSYLGGGVALVFLALCANVACLLLGRFTQRRREFRLCTALGASRGRLLSRSFVECALLAGVGIALGVALAQWLVSLAAVHLPEAFLSQTLHPLRIEPRALAVAVGGGALAAVVAGLLPCVAATSRAHLGGGRLDDRVSTTPRRARRLERSLLIGELALACVLLVGATLLVRSFVNMARSDRGFDPAGLMTVDVHMPGIASSDVAAITAMADRIESGLRSLPGVQAVSWSGGAPMSEMGTYHSYNWVADGQSRGEVGVDSSRVTPAFFSMYGIRLLRGRFIEAGEDPRHVVIGETLAEKLWPGVDPIGRSFTGGTMAFIVIGVVKEVRRTLVNEAPATMYAPFTWDWPAGTAGIRCAATCPSEAAIRHRMQEMGVRADLSAIHRLDDAIRYDIAQPRATAAVGAMFSGVAVLAAAGGLFSVLSYSVSRRRREFGIRTALGASTGRIASLVLREGLAVAAAGLGLGALAAWLLARTVASMQYGVTVHDPVSWATVVGLLAATTLAATWRPVRAAMRVDPMSLLKED